MGTTTETTGGMSVETASQAADAAKADASQIAEDVAPMLGDTVIQPTVGRRLHFRANGSPAAMSALGIFDASQPCDAGVTYVWSPRMVNVTVTGPSGAQVNYTSLTLRQPDDPVPPLCCFYVEWMDYQVRTAAA